MELSFVFPVPRALDEFDGENLAAVRRHSQAPADALIARRTELARGIHVELVDDLRTQAAEVQSAQARACDPLLPGIPGVNSIQQYIAVDKPEEISARAHILWSTYGRGLPLASNA